MSTDRERSLQRWMDAALIDAATAERIRAFEAEHALAQGPRWPVLLALAFGGLMLGAGVLLFVAAHWDTLSPGERFSLVLLMVAAFHIAGAWSAGRFEGLAVTMHALGTVTLGAGIFLAGQIFNLQEHWPGGLMLWALGAWIGWFLRRDWVQGTLAALLTPAWLAGEWLVATEHLPSSYMFDRRVLTEGLLMTAIAYFTARISSQASPLRRALVWIGGLALIPCVFGLIFGGHLGSGSYTLPLGMHIVGWAAAVGLPLLVSFGLRGRAAWMNGVALVWVLTMGVLNYRNSAEQLLLYLWCVAGAAVLVAWGIQEGRSERVNMGVAGFALTVFFFYFSTVMDKLGRSASLIGMGLLFLAGGWALEHLRRRLVARAKEARI